MKGVRIIARERGAEKGRLGRTISSNILHSQNSCDS